MKQGPAVNAFSLLAILALLLPAGMLAAQNPGSPAMTRLLPAGSTHSAQADDNAHTLASFTRFNFHP